MTLSPKDALLLLTLMGKGEESAIRPGQMTAEQANEMVQRLRLLAKEE